MKRHLRDEDKHIALYKRPSVHWLSRSSNYLPRRCLVMWRGIHSSAVLADARLGRRARLGRQDLPTNQRYRILQSGGSRTLGRRQEKVLVLLRFDGALAQTNQLLRRANPARQRVKLIKN